MDMDLDALESLVKLEEEAGPVRGRADLEVRLARRVSVREVLVPLKKRVQLLETRTRVLYPLPSRLDEVEWAERMLAAPLAILVLETTGTRNDSDVIRLVVADAAGGTLFDQIVRPGRQVGQANTAYTGISPEQVLVAPVLSDIWEHFRAQLASRTVLAYGLNFVLNRLNENARYYGLPLLQVRGECLLERGKLYYSSDSPLRLQEVCRKIGHTLPNPATALDRVPGQLAFLRAMSQGIMDVHYKPPRIVELDHELPPFEGDELP